MTSSAPLGSLACAAAAIFGFGLPGALALAAGPTEITACTTITEPGSYVLVNNLSPPLPGDCIVIAADYVTIDLHGFVITGLPDKSSGSKFGIGIGTASPPPPSVADNGKRRGVTLHDGTIVGFMHGVHLQSEDVRIQRIRSINNAGDGIVVLPCALCAELLHGGGLVSDCDASWNGGDGIVVWGFGAVITRNVAIENKGAGITTKRATVTANVANNNGTFGISADCPSTVAENTADSNSSSNLDLIGAGCVAAHNAAP